MDTVAIISHSELVTKLFFLYAHGPYKRRCLWVGLHHLKVQYFRYYYHGVWSSAENLWERGSICPSPCPGMPYLNPTTERIIYYLHFPQPTFAIWIEGYAISNWQELHVFEPESCLSSETLAHYIWLQDFNCSLTGSCLKKYLKVTAEGTSCGSCLTEVLYTSSFSSLIWQCLKCSHGSLSLRVTFLMCLWMLWVLTRAVQ